MTMAEKTRFVKVIRLCYSDFQKNKAESRINRCVNTIRENGAKVINIMPPTVIGVGLSVVYIVYNIVYEAENEIPTEYFKKDSKNE